MRGIKFLVVSNITIAISGPLLVSLFSVLPPFEHWVSLVGFATLFAAIFTVAGLFVGVEPMRRHKFVLNASGAVATFLALWVIAEGKYAEANYCYFMARFDMPKPDGRYEWQLVNK